MLNKSNIAKIALCLSIAWILGGPWLLTQTRFSILDFTHTGDIGSTIGGITAPVIGLVSAILIYLSFSAQIDANKIAQDEANFRYILDEFERIKTKIKKYKYYLSNRAPEWGTEKGSEALITFSENIYDFFELGTKQWIYDGSLDDVYYLLSGYSIFIAEDKRLSLSKNQRKIVELKIWLYHAENVKKTCDKIALWTVDNPGADAPAYCHKAYEVKMLALSINYEIGNFTASFPSNNL